MKIIYIDTETTGVNPKVNAVIQIAGTISVPGKSEDFDIRIAPRPEARIDEGAMARNGTTLEQMKSYPSSADSYKQFISLLSKYVDRYDRNDKLYFVGYNSSFDADFIREWFVQNNDEYFASWFWNPTLDVMQLVAFHLIGRRHELANFKLGTVYKYLFGEDFENAHEAGSDIKATRRILNYVMEQQKKL